MLYSIVFIFMAIGVVNINIKHKMLNILITHTRYTTQEKNPDSLINMQRESRKMPKDETSCK